MRQPKAIISHWYQLIDGLQAAPLTFYAEVQEAIRRRQVPDITVSKVTWRESGLFSARRIYLRVSRGRMAFDICAAPFGRGFFFSWWLAELHHAFGRWFLALILGAGMLAGWKMELATLRAVFPNDVVRVLWEVGLYSTVVIKPLSAAMAMFVVLLIIRIAGGEEAVLGIPWLGWLYGRIFAPITYYRLDTALMFQEAVRSSILEVIDGMMTQQGLRQLTDQERQPRLRELRLR